MVCRNCFTLYHLSVEDKQLYRIVKDQVAPIGGAYCVDCGKKLLPLPEEKGGEVGEFTAEPVCMKCVQEAIDKARSEGAEE